MENITAGQVLTARSICDFDCIFKILISSRKGNFATFKWQGEVVRKQIKRDDRGEYIRVANYSMAPVFRAA
jgi:hypothetical protein